MSRDILTVIRNSMGTFSKGQKLIGRFILENYDKAAFMTASRLGKTVSVSESTWSALPRSLATTLPSHAKGAPGDDSEQADHGPAH